MSGSKYVSKTTIAASVMVISCINILADLISENSDDSHTLVTIKIYSYDWCCYKQSQQWTAIKFNFLPIFQPTPSDISIDYCVGY